MHQYNNDPDIEENQAWINKEWPVFHSPNLTWFCPPYFPVSLGATVLLGQLERDHFLILGGIRNPEKCMLARHLAWLLSDHLGLADTPNVVGEWIRNSGLQRLEIELEKETTHPIVILPDIHPKHLGHNLAKIRDMVLRSGQYILVTTDTAASDWNLSASDRDQIWLDLAPCEIYDAAYLTAHLNQCLDEFSGQMHVSQETVVYEGMSLADIALRLGAPFHIRTFIREALAHSELPQRGEIEQIIARIQADERAVLNRIRRMDYREQVLMSGLVFFDGLPGDQFFAALDVLTEQVWRMRTPDLRFFDRGDLIIFQELLRRLKYNLQLPSRPQKDMLSRLLWKEHRSLIKAVLPTLVTLARSSANYQDALEGFWEPLNADSGSGAEKTSRWLMEGTAKDLYGSKIHCQQIRLVIGNFLGFLGRHSVSFVERSLLELAADASLEVQSIAAKAMASWRESSETEQKLFRLLDEWLRDTRILQDMEALLDSEHNRGRAREYIFMTIAQTIGFAGAYDPPNQMSCHLLKLLRVLDQESSPALVRCFEAKTIPEVLQKHLLQLAPEAEKWMLTARRLPFVALGVALAFPFQPEAAQEVVDRWRHQAATLPAAGNRRPPDRREALLACIALCHGYREDNGRSLVENAYSDWWAILEDEDCLSVREAVFDAILLRTLENFHEMEPCLRQITLITRPQEQQRLIDILGAVYIEQRADLQGGDLTFTYDNQIFPVWLNEARPLTPVEQVMGLWENITGNPAAGQIAIGARLAFRIRLDDPESRFVEDLKSEEDKRDNSPAARKRRKLRNQRISKERNGLLETALIYTVVTNKRLRPKIIGIMPSLWGKHKQEPDLLKRLEEEEMAGPEIVWFIERLLRIRRYGIPFFAGLLIAMALLIIFY